MRPLLLTLALFAACADGPDGRLAQDGTSSLDLVAPCPECETDEPVGPIVEGTLYVDVPQYDTQLRFRATRQIVENGLYDRFILSIEPLGEDPEPPRYEAESLIVDGEVDLAWETIQMPSGSTPLGPAPLKLRLRGCVGRLADLCGDAEASLSHDATRDGAWGFASTPCPATCD